MAQNVSQTGGTLLDTVVEVMIPTPIVQFLNTTIIRKPFFILNYWSFVHLLAGVLFFLIFPKKLKLWIWINVIFEITEFLLALGGNPLFVEETIDTILDIFWSVGGFILARYVAQKIKKK